MSRSVLFRFILILACLIAFAGYSLALFNLGQATRLEVAPLPLPVYHQVSPVSSHAQYPRPLYEP